MYSSHSKRVIIDFSARTFSFSYITKSFSFSSIIFSVFLLFYTILGHAHKLLFLI
ncbi:hypothetical protein CHCC14820_3422 [Bacillus paralicheniformis]|uniref:Uncharacterized protein n=1 Tax=Bacillus paralicheniformis TaxID=1648923 RepID=A0A7Z0X0B9_9BACI|nr:hypothetical protein B4121_0739 [Bacillus paralicheniformis]OLG08593.1 hypothetical protein B4125_0169 [Bacillus paralicheniformis]TWJ35215.1 hypothetical protein CHCC5027_2967 [Bacillus paralicheniformis]TWJ57751.1 hypothetical protein CHCC5022_4220 [Bacillus paralicheniformis]TWJ66144.1 hypothetical protein CHCC5021_0420 [Bacillus paralicheniformis]